MWVFLRSFLIFVALSAQIFAQDSLVSRKKLGKPEFTFVSLGGSCHIGIALRHAGLKGVDYPFDWLISTNHESFIHIIDDDFQFFTDAGCFVEHLGVPCCINKYYNIAFPHDFDITNATQEQILKQWNVFKNTYDHRIQKFRQLRESRGKVFFVRALWSQLIEGENGEFNENTKRASDIRNALDRFFPNLNFTLVIISYPELNIPKMQNIKGVVELKIGRSNQEFKAAMQKLMKIIPK